MRMRSQGWWGSGADEVGGVWVMKQWSELGLGRGPGGKGEVTMPQPLGALHRLYPPPASFVHLSTPLYDYSTVTPSFSYLFSSPVSILIRLSPVTKQKILQRGHL